MDDYYLNLLDWNQQNVLAVCLAQTVYLWNSVSGEIQQLYDTEDDEAIVTSVAWMHKHSNVLAVGNSKNEIVLMDAERFAPMSVIKDQHQGRISSMAWNPVFSDVLSSGSIDSQILNNDVRAPPSQSLFSVFRQHRQEVCGLKWSPNGQQLASGGNDNMLCIWDVNSRFRS